MSIRHRITAITLLSSSFATASPAPARPAGFIARATALLSAHRPVAALTDDDGYPLVGNMHGKRPEPVERQPVEPAAVELARADRSPTGK